ncbi:hypothetical protein B5807_06233 [Epicoccum nigrum]|uniref:Uncharacterized protein n=1 Tax=Epicoccum nigrum TaxID=105696 RepID=A0A1Y2M0X7_EPING|nr:hypothetical protein B5807_06233 [Epicoccum nigrum]
MPIRNPFRRAPEATDEAQRNAPDNEFKNTAVTGAQPQQIKDPAEYKLSEINDSGVYLPVRRPLETSKSYDRNATTAPSHTSNVNNCTSRPHNKRSLRSGIPSRMSQLRPPTTEVSWLRPSRSTFRARVSIRTGDHLTSPRDRPSQT